VRGRVGASKAFWGVAAPVGILAALAWFVWSERATLATGAEAPLTDLLLIALLFTLAHLLNSAEFWALFKATGTRLALFENWMLFTAAQLANHLPAKLGTIYRFRYMRSVHGVPYVGSVAVHAANLVITIAGAGVAGTAGVLGSAAVAGTPLSIPMLLLFAAMVAAASSFALFPLPRLAGREGRLGGIWGRFHEGFEELRHLPGTALVAVAIEALKYSVTAWRLQVTFALIGIVAPYWTFLVLAPAAGVASFISFTPAALGFRELVVTGAGVAMGLTLTGGLLGATVDRAVMLATFLVLGGTGFLVTYPRLRAAESSGPTPGAAVPAAAEERSP